MNGAAKAAFKTVKSIIKKCDDVNLGLLAYRTTALENGFSPSEMMLSRKARSRVPVFPESLGSFRDHERVSFQECKRKTKQEHMYNKRHMVKNLSKLSVTDKVWVIYIRMYGEVIREGDCPNSFTIKTVKGSTIKRNRWHLVPAPYKSEAEIRVNDTPIIPNDFSSDADNTANIGNPVRASNTSNNRDIISAQQNARTTLRHPYRSSKLKVM